MIRVFFIDNSNNSGVGVLLEMTSHDNTLVIPREGESIQINDDDFIIDRVSHSFISGSPNQVIEIALIDTVEYLNRGKEI